MIQFPCPTCAKKLSVDEANAGRVAVCAGCGGKFRIPGGAAAAKAERNAAPQPPAAPAVTRSTRSSGLDEEDSAPIGLAGEPSPPEPPPRTKPARKSGPAARTEEAGDEDDEAPVKKKRKKKADAKKTSLVPLFVVLGVVGAVAAISGLLYLGKGMFESPPPNPDEALAAIARLEGIVRRDDTPEKNVVEINFAGNVGVSNGDLKHLNAFPMLRKLELNHTKIGDIGLMHLRYIKSLEYLDLSSTQVVSGADELSGLTNLKELHLNNTLVLDNSLASLKTCKKLEKLYLMDCPYAHGADLESAIPNLKIIRDIESPANRLGDLLNR